MHSVWCIVPSEWLTDKPYEDLSLTFLCPSSWILSLKFACYTKRIDNLKNKIEFSDVKRETQYPHEFAGYKMYIGLPHVLQISYIKLLCCFNFKN